MKRSNFKQLSRRAAALTLAVVMAIPTAFATAGTKKLTTTQSITDGLTYTNTITDHSSAGRVESYSFQLSPNSQVYPIMVQSAGTIYGAATINKAISYAESLGYNVIGGINSDFFDWNGVPIGISIENGVYKSSPEGRHSVAWSGSGMELSMSSQVGMTVTNQRTNTSATVNHFNKWRDSSGGLYLYNEDFSTVSTRTDNAGGRMIRMELVDEEKGADLGVNSTLTLKVTEVFDTDQSVTIGTDNYILTSSYESGYYELFAGYQVGDLVTLTTTCTDPVLSRAQWAGGCGDIMVYNGTVTDSSSWAYAKDGRNPRTALGVKADGTMVFYEVDGRQSGYSGGLSEKDLANELLSQGCVWAVNLDGGGSSILSARLPGSNSVSIQSSPSGGSARSCATFILLVTDDPGTGPATRLALKEDGLVVLAGTSVTLGDVASVNAGAKTVDSRVSDATFTSSGLGSFNGSVYTAGSTAGTDTITIHSDSLGLSGTAQIHVVTSLSKLTVTKSNGSALSSLSMKAGESVQLSATGTYWSRSALRSSSTAVTWGVTGGVGTITADGLFTASGNSSSGTITATAGGITTSIPVSLENVHNDVTPDHWSYTAVEYCYEHGIVSGVSSTEFGRDLSIQRGDFVLMLYNSLGKPAVTGSLTFTDVSPTDYYAKAIIWASANGLASGVGDGLFAPTAPVTREQAFTMLHQAMPLLGIESPEPDLSVLDQFSDKDQIADYAKPHMAALVAQGVASGAGGVINPKTNLSRAEMAALLYRLLTYDTTEEPTEPTQPDPDATLTLDQAEATLESAKTLTLTATLTGTQVPITWTSSNPAIATVDSNGVVTNVYTGAGTAQVTITATCGSLSASAVIQCQSAQRIGVVTAEPTLNVRSGPGTQYDVVSRLSFETQVIVLDDSQAGWYQILFSDASGKAITGYVSSDYLSIAG